MFRGFQQYNEGFTTFTMTRVTSAAWVEQISQGMFFERTRVVGCCFFFFLVSIKSLTNIYQWKIYTDIETYYNRIPHSCIYKFHSQGQLATMVQDTCPRYRKVQSKLEVHGCKTNISDRQSCLHQCSTQSLARWELTVLIRRFLTEGCPSFYLVAKIFSVNLFTAKSRQMHLTFHYA